MCNTTGTLLGLTRHACFRARERAITLSVVALVCQFGRAVFTPRGRQLSLRGVDRPRDVPRQEWSAARDVVVVESAEGVIVTVFRGRGQ